MTWRNQAHEVYSTQITGDDFLATNISFIFKPLMSSAEYLIIHFETFKYTHHAPRPKKTTTTQLQISCHSKISVNLIRIFPESDNLYNQRIKSVPFMLRTEREIWTAWKWITVSMSQNTQHYDKLNKQSWNMTAVRTVSCFSSRNMIQMSFSNCVRLLNFFKEHIFREPKNNWQPETWDHLQKTDACLWHAVF